MQIDKKADFVLREDKIVYPPVRTDGLELYYDTKGKKNTDTYKNKLLDMSGNGRHGELHNFNYKNLSGYQEDSKLVFDGIDDKLVLGDVEEPEIISATKNLFDGAKFEIYQQSGDVSWDGSKLSYTRTNDGRYSGVRYKFLLSPGKTYTLSLDKIEGNNQLIIVYDENMNQVQFASINSPFTATTKTTYIVFSYSSAGDEGRVLTNIQLEEGSTATPYVPYIPTAKMTYQLNNNIISCGEGGAVKWVKDGNVMERKGVNLIRNGNFWNGTNGWNRYQSNISITNNGSLKVENNGGNSYAQVWRYIDLAPRSKYYFRTKIEIGNRNTNVNIHGWFSGGERKNEKSYEYELVKENISEEINRQQLKFSDSSTPGDYYYISNIQLINLTATFGAGNEPTLEEIQATSDKWQWLPNPMDLLEAKELGGNILGDMEDIVDAPPRDRQSGKEVFTEHADDSHVEVEVDGQSYQHAGNGGDLIKESDSIYTWIGTHNVRADTGAFFFISAPYSPATYQIEARAVDDNLVGAEFGWQWRSTIRGKTITLSKEWKKASAYFEDGPISIGLRVVDGTGLIELRHIKAEEGTTATPYIPELSPDYPIEINSLKDFDVVSGVWRNLVNQRGQLDGLGLNSNWDDYYRNADNSVSTHLIEVKEGEELRFTKETTGFDEYWRNQWWDSDMNFIRRFVNTSNDFTIKVPRNAKYLRVSYPTNSNPKIDRDFIRLSDTPSYHELIDKINLSLSEPLRSVGDVKDRVYKDGDGLWKIERNIGEVTLDGTEPWVMEAHYWYMSWSSRYGATKNSFNVKSSHFVWRDRGVNDGVTTGITYGGKNLSQKTHNGNLIFYHPTHSNVTEFKEFLKSEHLNGIPVIIQYELESPEIETLGQDLQDKLNNLRSFKDSNYVYTIINGADDLPSHIAENLKPTIHTEFLAKDHFKESRAVNNLLIWNRLLEDEELLSQNKLFHGRFSMRSNTIKGEPINQEINLLNGGVFGHSLERNYTIEI